MKYFINCDEVHDCGDKYSASEIFNLIKNFKVVKAVNTPAFQRFITMDGVKKHNWFLNHEAKLYFYYFTKNQVKHIIILELSDEMVALTKKPNYMGYGIWQG